MAREEKSYICEWCGKKRTITNYVHYDVDHMGYPTGGSRLIQTIDPGCDCALGNLIKNKNKNTIKPMCKNCSFNQDGECINEKTKNSLSTMFNVKTLRITDDCQKCNNYKFNIEMLMNLINIQL